MENHSGDTGQNKVSRRDRKNAPAPRWGLLLSSTLFHGARGTRTGDAAYSSLHKGRQPSAKRTIDGLY